ncbi:hypothetical protein [Bradyrhizobium manausense]|uniref:Uncharacterized protein n=1 Tax=Bradyrhizobium manausense TaxID=989370 RepID=A0A0R3D0T2_9BRAD|nr:hypothetical protein [Bradyrhizobium manausense]KRQ03281.1 hypothetical protein AOQ71_31630 [Bradyrhizobium manausense]
MTTPTMAQFRQQQLNDLNNKLDAAVTNGDTAEARKISGEIANIASAPVAKFSADDVRAAIIKLAPEAATSIKLRTKLNTVMSTVSQDLTLVQAHETADSLAREILSAADYALPDDGDADDAGDEPAPRPTSRRAHREEPQLGAGDPRPTGGRGLEKASKVSDLPSASREAWARQIKGPMSEVAKAAERGDAASKALLAKAEASFVQVEKTRLRQQRGNR